MTTTPTTIAGEHDCMQNARHTAKRAKKSSNKNNNKRKSTDKKTDSAHPSLDIVSTSGTELHGKKIVLCISGSVAAYKAIELARLLMRHGCKNVTCVASKAATRLIRPAYLKWATGNDVVTDLTGNLEHIRLADYNKSDLVIVYPATANTISKLANGIDDAPIPTVLTVALGSKTPIVICPAMHESMYENPAVLRNIRYLTQKSVVFAGPQMIEGKAKAPEPEYILDNVIIPRFGAGIGSPLKGKRVLLTAGPTVEYIDPVRMITNKSSGKTGVLLCEQMLKAGAKVHMIYGPGREEPPTKGVTVTRVETSAQMHKALRLALKDTIYDVVVMAAAVSDYAPTNARRTKIDSSPDTYVVKLKRVPKIIQTVKRIQKNTFLVGFKAECNISQLSLQRAAQSSIKENGSDMVIANDIGKKYHQYKNQSMNNVMIATKTSSDVLESGWHKKETVARFITKAIEHEFLKHYNKVVKNKNARDKQS